MDDDFFGEAAPPAPPADAAPAAVPDNDDDFFGGGGEAALPPPAEAAAAAFADDTDDTNGFGGDDFAAAPAAASAEDSFTAVVEAEEAAEAETDLVVDEGEAVAAPEAVAEAPPTAADEPIPAAAAAVEPEPEEEGEREIPPLVKWEMENREAVDRRDREAAAKLETLRQEAQGAVAHFYAERKTLTASNHERNVGAEAEVCKQRDALFSHGDVWERVVSLIDLKGVNEKKHSRVSRMRSLLLHMKNEPK